MVEAIRKKNFLGRGWKFPFQVNGRGGISQAVDEDLVQDSIAQILLTAFGERFHRRDFGSGLKELPFEPNDNLLERLVRGEVFDSLERFERRIDILEASVFGDPKRAELANIEIAYKISSENKIGNMVIPFFITGEAVTIVG